MNYLPYLYSIYNSSCDENIKNWKLFELYSCYKLGFIPWSLLDPDIRDNFNINCKDMGIDGISSDLSTSLQCKLRNNNYITYTELSTFYTYSSVLNCKTKIISHNESAKISKDTKLLMDRLNVDLIQYTDLFIDEIKTLLQSYKPTISKPLQKYTLRPYQNEVMKICDITQEINIEIPCGCGKTILYCEIVKKYNSTCVIFVPTLQLMEQTYDVLTKFTNKNIIRVGTNYNNNVKEVLNNVYICVYNSVKYISDFDIKYAIVDEAHHIENINNDTYLQQIKDLDCNKIHFSGTFKNKEKLDYKYSFEDAIKDKYLTDYDIIIPTFKMRDDYNVGLVKLLQQNPYLDYVLAYCNDIESATEFTILLNKHKISSICITGDMSINTRLKYIRKFEKEEIRVIVSVYVLSEGIDIPRATCCMFVQPRSSKINVIQCVGRVLRLHPEKKLAHIILPTTNEENQLLLFLKIMSEHDSRVRSSIIRGSYGRINWAKIVFENDEDDINVDIIDIYDRLGKQIAGTEITNILRYNKLVEEGIKITRETVLDEWNVGTFRKLLKTKFKNNKLSEESIILLSTNKDWIDYSNKIKKDSIPRLEKIKILVDKVKNGFDIDKNNDIIKIEGKNLNLNLKECFYDIKSWFKINKLTTIELELLRQLPIWNKWEKERGHIKKKNIDKLPRLEKIKIYIDYIKTNNIDAIPKTIAINDEKWGIRMFQGNIRRYFKQGKITDIELKLLRKTKEWNEWEKEYNDSPDKITDIILLPNIDKIKMYNEQVNKNINITSRLIIEINNIKWHIGDFVRTLRKKYKKNALTKEELKLLSKNKDWNLWIETLS